jgi:predicted DNA-binding protein with PD1-like motif
MSSSSVRRTINARLEEDADLYGGMSRIAREHRVYIGRVTGQGRVKKARLASYDQKQLRSIDVVVPGPMEIVSLSGTITLRDDRPVVHAHLVLSDDHGNGTGGELLPGGTPVLDCELKIEVL